MNGWQRLWVVISAIWLLVVVSYAVISIQDTYTDPDGPWIFYSLSANAKEFYKDLEKNEKGPMYTVTFKFTDGSEQSVRFPLLEKPVGELKLGDQLNRLARENNKQISRQEIAKFINNVSKSNSRAKQAKKEYESKVQEVRQNSTEKRRNIIINSLLMLIAPPIGVLIMGYSVAWVRRGFSN